MGLVQTGFGSHAVRARPKPPSWRKVEGLARIQRSRRKRSKVWLAMDARRDQKLRHMRKMTYMNVRHSMSAAALAARAITTSPRRCKLVLDRMLAAPCGSLRCHGKREIATARDGPTPGKLGGGFDQPCSHSQAVDVALE